MTRRPIATASAALLAMATVLLAGCSGQLGALCEHDDDCAGELRCALEPGASRGACAYPSALTDLGPGIDGSSRDSSPPDQRVDSGEAGVDASQDLSDLGSDLPGDLGSDLGSDLPGDLGSDLGSDLGVDLGSDLASDDLGRDGLADASGEQSGADASDAAPAPDASGVDQTAD